MLPDNGGVCLFGAENPKLCVGAVGREEPHVCNRSSLNGRARRPPGSAASLTRRFLTLLKRLLIHFLAALAKSGSQRQAGVLRLVNECEPAGADGRPR